MAAELSEQNPSTATTPPQEQGDVRFFLRVVSFFAVCAIAFVAWAVFFRADPTTDKGLTDRRLADFSLVERSGRTVNRSELAGKYLVVNFVHTSCSISCFQVNQRMSKIQEQLAGRNDVRLVSISVDPQTDTPPVLAKFASQFSADPERWLFLTGERRAIDSLLESSFIRRPPEAPRSSLFAATDKIMIVDDTGRVREQFNGMKWAAPETVLAALDRLRAEKNP